MDTLTYINKKRGQNVLFNLLSFSLLRSCTPTELLFNKYTTNYIKVSFNMLYRYLNN